MKDNYISAAIIADSLTPGGSRLTTFEVEYPRFITAEVLTHKMLSKNSQSSRAVPVVKVREANTRWVKPIVFGKNTAGMSSKEVLQGWRLVAANLLWNTAAKTAFALSTLLQKVGLHKQWANRLTEPYSKIKVVISGTEWDNFFWLRDDPEAAQPEIVDLARKMKVAYSASEPQKLKAGEWHTPYVAWHRINGKQVFFDSKGEELTTEEALNISASCCAQVSYRKLNDTKEKALDIFHKLFSGAKPHYSPVEHQGCVMQKEHSFSISNEFGVSHTDKAGFNWSGNLKGFIQYRKVLEYAEQMLRGAKNGN